MTLYVGDDWAEAHHDVHLMNEAGERIAARRLPEGVEGVAALHELVAEHASEPGDVVLGIETGRGLWVSALVAAGYHVYAINPRSVARYRERHHVGGAKSDAGDAKVLADLVRTDRHNHREVAGDTDEAAAVRILARAHQQFIWDRTRRTDQPASQRAPRVLPGGPGGLPRPCSQRRGGRAGNGPGPACGGAADQAAAPGRPPPRRPPAPHRPPRHRDPRRAAVPAARGGARGEQCVRRDYQRGGWPDRRPAETTPARRR